MASNSAREKFVDKQLCLLDKRLALVEKFVQLRFGKAFHHFVNDEDTSDDEGIVQGTSKEPKTIAKSVSRRKPRVNTRSRAVPISNEASTGKDSTAGGDGGTRGKATPKVRTEEKSEIVEGRSRYNTRRRVKVEVTVAEVDETVSASLEEIGDLEQTGVEGQGQPLEVELLTGNKEYVIPGSLNDEIQEDNTCEDIANSSYIILPDISAGDEGVDEGRIHRKRGIRRNRKRSAKPKQPKAKKKKTFPSKFNEDGTLKKRVYPPAISSSLPGIARTDSSRKECQICHKHIKSELFDVHLDSHVKERHLKCSECDKTYFNQAMLRKHRMVHQPEKYGKKCRLCGKVFFQTDKKYKHEQFCAKMALSRNEEVDLEVMADLKTRFLGWTPETPTPPNPSEMKKCPYCSKEFKASFYQRHLRLHTGTKEWACKSCDKAYFYKHDLVRHYAAEHRSPICDLCSKTFEDKIELKEHVLECRKVQRALKAAKAKESQSQNEFVEEAHDSQFGGGETTFVVLRKLDGTNFHELETATGTIISEDAIVVASDVEVSQFEVPQQLILVDEKLQPNM